MIARQVLLIASINNIGQQNVYKAVANKLRPQYTCPAGIATLLL